MPAVPQVTRISPEKILFPTLERGNLADIISDRIREHEVDLVVSGTHGRRGVCKLVVRGARTVFRVRT